MTTDLTWVLNFWLILVLCLTITKLVGTQRLQPCSWSKHSGGFGEQSLREWSGWPWGILSQKSWTSYINYFIICWKCRQCPLAIIMLDYCNNGTAHIVSRFFIIWAIGEGILSPFNSVTQSCPTLRPHELQHARPPCPSPTPRVCSNSCPSR